MLFSIITINPKDTNTTIDILSKELNKILQNILPVKFIDYATFKQGTETAPVSLYILNKNNLNNFASHAKDIESVKGMFNKGIKIGQYTTGMEKNFDPRYMVLDVHDISEEQFKEKFAIRILMSEKIPVSQFSILREVAKQLSTDYITTIFSVSKEANTNIEAVERYEVGRIIDSGITREGSGVIGKYTNKWNISINKILARLDRNIEVLMAPKDLEEIEGILLGHYMSKRYIESLPASSETREMQQIERDILQTISEIDRIKEFIMEEPKVISSYMRIYDPVKLKDFRIKDVKLQQINKEVWS